MAQYQTIVTGHGHFASGLQAAIKLLAGEQPTLTFVDFSDGMSEDDLGTKLAAISAEKPTLFFTDLVGGTPYKESAKIAFARKDVAVVAGCNLASLLETIFADYATLNDYASALVESTKRSAQVLDLSDDEPEEQDDFSDGI